MEQFYTYREIRQQPDVWLKEYASILSRKDEIVKFIRRYLEDGYEIYFTGAGTSAYIGDALAFAFAGTVFSDCRSVPTTDIVTDYRTFFPEGKKVLLISFARSGNSPESIGAVKIANKVATGIAHVFITCNAEGELARMASGSPENTLLVLLPPETNDVSLAMTSSFSTMVMSCLMLAEMDSADSVGEKVAAVSRLTAAAMDRYEGVLREIAQRPFKRAVFLGSGFLKGIAEESHLKLQELTDGDVMCTFDSFLGFRHGPKAVVREEPLLVYLLSDDPYTRQYEIDLIRQIDGNNRAVAQVLVSADDVQIDGVEFDARIVLNEEKAELGNYGYVPYVFVAQMLGCFKSVDLGLSPDAPSKSGNIHRVVKGVTIYDI